MTRRVVEEPLDPSSLARGTEDAASGALVVLCEPARDVGDGGAGAPRGEGARPNGTDGGPDAGRPETPAGEGPAERRAERTLEALEEEALDRFAVRRCRLRLRPGAPRGETAVVAVVRAPHRQDAFDAAQWAVAAVRERLLPGGP